MKKTLAVLLAFLTVVLLMCAATAAESKVPANAQYYKGHAYALYNMGKDWVAAKKYCEKLGGHLVTITSSGEQSFIEKLLRASAKKNKYWIGGIRVDGGFAWVTGEKWKYTHWHSGEPNNWNGHLEDRVMIHAATSGSYASYFGDWNDLYRDGSCPGLSYYSKGSMGFICEWDLSVPTKLRITGNKTVSKGNQIQLTATVSPAGASQSVLWLSSDESIATVNRSGVVKGKSAGKVTITALSLAKSSISGSVTIQVLEKPVKSVTITCDSKLINTKDTLPLKVEVKPADALQTIEWTSSNTDVATVSADGILKAVGKGTVTITAKAVDGSNKKATVKIKVQEGLSYKAREQIVKNATVSYLNSVNPFIVKENNEITSLKNWFTKKQSKLEEEVDKSVESAVAIDAQTPPKVKTAFLQKITGTIHSDMSKSPAKYDNCKTVLELMNKVIKDITAGKSTFTFKCDGKTYIVELTKMGVWNAYASMGSIRQEGQDRKYSVIFTSVSNSAINETLRSLSKFAQSNMKSACDEAIRDLVVTTLSAGKVDEILKDFQAIEADPIFDSLPKGRSKTKTAIKVATTALPLMKEPVKLYNAIVKFDLDSVTDEKLTKKADELAEKLKAFNDAAYDFMKPQ